MLNKKTIVFITDNQKNDVARLIKKEFEKDNSYVYIAVKEKEVESRAKHFFIDVLGARTIRFRDDVAKFFVKLFNIKTKSKPKAKHRIYETTKVKKMTNLCYRYNPTVIVTNSFNALSGIVKTVKDIGIKTIICMLWDEYAIDERIISSEVNTYFVDNICVRNALLRNGISADKIDVNPLPVDSEYYGEYNQGDNKEKLGFARSRKLVLIDASDLEDNNFKEIIDASSRHDGECDFAIYCGHNRINYDFAISKKLSAFNETTSSYTLYSAADAIVCRPKAEKLKCATALKKPVLTAFSLGENERANADYLLADERVKYCASIDDYKRFLTLVEDNRATPSSDSIDRHSTEKIVEKIKQLI